MDVISKHYTLEDYKILTASDENRLANDVRQHVNKGYDLYGPPFYCPPDPIKPGSTMASAFTKQGQFAQCVIKVFEPHASIDSET